MTHASVTAADGKDVCWICGSPAASREHRVKRSDLKLIFPDVTPRTSIYTRDPNTDRIIHIGSLNSDKLKWNSKICHHCNTTRTQNADRAWMALSTYLQSHASREGTLNTKKVFPGSTTRSLLNVHLFFNKLVGCLISDHPAPLSLAPFSQAIMHHNANPFLFLGFGILKKSRPNKAFITPMQARVARNEVEFANFHYNVKQVFVDIVYARDRKYLLVATNTWHPSMKSKYIRLSDFRVNHQIAPETVGYTGAL
jgi:hypothetical protein